MARQRRLDETDRCIVEAIQEYRNMTGTGPSLQDIADATCLNLKTVAYRIKTHLVPAGLVRHTAYERGSLEVVETTQ